MYYLSILATDGNLKPFGPWGSRLSKSKHYISPMPIYVYMLLICEVQKLVKILPYTGGGWRRVFRLHRRLPWLLRRLGLHGVAVMCWWTVRSRAGSGFLDVSFVHLHDAVISGQNLPHVPPRPNHQKCWWFSLKWYKLSYAMTHDGNISLYHFKLTFVSLFVFPIWNQKMFISVLEIPAIFCASPSLTTLHCVCQPINSSLISPKCFSFKDSQMLMNHIYPKKMFARRSKRW